MLGLLPFPERTMARFAMGSGLRQSEQWSLHLVDVHLDTSRPFVRVRFGSPFDRSGAYNPRPTKGGAPRDVPLFGIALHAIRVWLKYLPEHASANPYALVFPKPDGAPRRKGRVCRAWSRVGRVLGRGFRWHDLRHTCASSLVGGWWGSVWSLEEVRLMLGHSSIVVTERYAHFAGDALSRAAARHAESTEREGTGIEMNERRAVDGPSSRGVEGAEEARHLSSAVEQRFRNTDEFPPGGLTDEEEGEALDASILRHRADGVLVVILKDLATFPTAERRRLLAVLRDFFPGDWPGDIRRARGD